MDLVVVQVRVGDGVDVVIIVFVVVAGVEHVLHGLEVGVGELVIPLVVEVGVVGVVGVMVGGGRGWVVEGVDSAVEFTEINAEGR